MVVPIRKYYNCLRIDVVWRAGSFDLNYIKGGETEPEVYERYLPYKNVLRSMFSTKCT